jgi:copper chaperone
MGAIALFGSRTPAIQPVIPAGRTAYTPIITQPPAENDMKFEFAVQNVKCGGCASAIQTGLRQDARVREVAVDVPTGQVTVETEGDSRAELSATLKTLGYPEKV